MSVSISGIGAVSSAGNGAEALWQAAVTNESKIENGIGIIPGMDLSQKPLQISILAIQEAMDQAGWHSLNADDGFILATTTGYLPVWEQAVFSIAKNPSELQSLKKDLAHERLGVLFDQICTSLNFTGKRLLITTACTASTQAIGLAKKWVESGNVKRCLVGGTEVLSTLTLSGFRSLQLLSTDTCRPFDRDRRGINLSEGAAFLTIEKKPKISLAHISGAGFSMDAYHATSPHPEGKGSIEAIEMALRDAQLSPQDITWVHAHGTGSQSNDIAETKALTTVFKGQSPPVSSTKGIHGHALAASGALETILCVKALQNQILLPTYGHENRSGEITTPIAVEASSGNLNHILKNTLGFGGANASLIFSRVGETR